MAVSTVFDSRNAEVLPAARAVVPRAAVTGNAGNLASRILPAAETADQLLPKINLTFGDDVSHQTNRVVMKSPYARHAMQWVEFGFDDSLKAFVSVHAALIQEPGLDGKPFAPVMAVATRPGEEVYARGMALDTRRHGFLEVLMAVVEDCRLEQFPWLKEILPERTYKQLSVLQIPRRPQPPGPPACYME